MSTKTVVVTGATGFVGQHVCRNLSGRGYRVIGVRKDIEARPTLSSLVDDWLQWDLSSGGSVVLPHGIDAIVHLAQSHQFRDFPAGAHDVFAVNMSATFSLLEAARAAGVSRFVYASSGGIYGQGSKVFTEQQPVIADSRLGFYLTSKLVGELLVQNYGPFFSVAILRIFFAYGPGQQEDRLIMRLIANVSQGRALTLSGSDGLTINPIYVTDAAEAIARTLEAPGPMTLNIAGSETISLRQLGHLIGGIVGKEPTFKIDNSTVPTSLIGDPTLLCDSLNFTPTVSLREGIRNAADDLSARQRQ